MFETGTRESMRHLHPISQSILTWITGKPLNVKEFSLILPRWLDVVVTPILAVLAVAALVRLSTIGTPLAWIAIIALWLLLVGQLRKMQVTHMHHAIHNRLFNRALINKIYANLIPALLFIQNASEYRKEHLEHHNAKIFTTKLDSDAAFLAKIGFIPGRTKSELWMNLWITIFSPVFHLFFAKTRLTSTFLRAKPSTILMSIIATCGYATLLIALGWKTFLIAILVPLFPLYHISALFQFLTEHAWNVVSEPVLDYGHYAERCWGRFCGETFPEYIPGSGIISTVRFSRRVVVWALKMLFLHLPTRVACLVSDLPAHDWHHLAHLAGQNSRDWQRSFYLRQAAIENGDIAGFAKRELWGMPRMITHQFASLESIVCHYEQPRTKLSKVREMGTLNKGEIK